ncbi:MAG TPA: peptide chain release factor 2 [Alphaproteobacteria bacterium]|nr:peptide chain release factor 2 [Alphaproteobacteria bacterium]USO06026.1 MAG: peptide chain release factor 2 [Rhodospirillales bacterium]HOO81760.1 peptide chain release factor 2 [Alphaproteobacteria bacterium]
MKAETESIVRDIEMALALLRRHLDWDVSVLRLDELNALSENPDIWNDADKAQKVMRERNRLDDQISNVRALEQSLSDNVELIALGEEEGDEAVVAEAEQALEVMKATVERRQLQSLLSGEADSNDAYLQVNAGAGGTEAQDWANMILRMYTRWAEGRGYKVCVLEMSDGEEAGIKSATLKIEGDQAYGWLKTETGVHRLVRISPFDSNARRHTSFASVAVSPVIDDDIDIEVEENDLRIDTYRSSGAGGQHVNTTDSAVRITHIPTGIVAAVQSERSQHQNRANAMALLKAKLYEAELHKREEQAAAEHGEKTDIGWGHQIRSYVLHPYQMIKDLRTGVETSQSAAVLDGGLDRFLEAALAQKLHRNEENS